MIRHAGIQIRHGSLSVRDVDIEDSPTFGIIGSPDANDGPSKLRLRDVTVTRSGLDGIRGTQVNARTSRRASTASDPSRGSSGGGSSAGPR